MRAASCVVFLDGRGRIPFQREKVENNMKQSEVVRIFGQKYIFYLCSSCFFLLSFCNVSWDDIGLDVSRVI